jgi:hypothetical protein
MMRGIYLTCASIIPTGMYGMANWHAAEGVLRGFITGENCQLPRRRPDLRPQIAPGFERSWSLACMLRLPKSKTRSVGPSAGEVPPSDPESRERLEILPAGAGDRVFPSSCDSKAT